MFFYFGPNFIEKFLWESVFFQIFAKIEMTRNKNWLFGCHFETVQHLKILFFSGIMVPNSSYIYVQISLQNSSGKMVFLKGVPWKPLLGTNGSKSTLVT